MPKLGRYGWEVEKTQVRCVSCAREPLSCADTDFRRRVRVSIFAWRSALTANNLRDDELLQLPRSSTRRLSKHRIGYDDKFSPQLGKLLLHHASTISPYYSGLDLSRPQAAFWCDLSVKSGISLACSPSQQGKKGPPSSPRLECRSGRDPRTTPYSLLSDVVVSFTAFYGSVAVAFPSLLYFLLQQCLLQLLISSSIMAIAHP
jgi:hypothetical protein